MTVKQRRNRIILIATLVVLLVAGLGVYKVVANFASAGCLYNDEYAEFSITDKSIDGEPSTVTINIRSREDDNVIYSFTESILHPRHYHPVEIRPCAVFFTRSFNFDHVNNLPLPEYRAELWKYSYTGTGVPIVLLGEGNSDETPTIMRYYNNDFRTRVDGKYIALTRGARGDALHGLVIVSPNVEGELYAVEHTTLLDQYPDLTGTLVLSNWTSDGRYFWVRISDGPYVTGWIRIDTREWSHEVFEAPGGVLGGYPLNSNTGWIPRMEGVFYPMSETDTEEERARRVEAGETTSLYLYNVLTQEELLIEASDEPLWMGLGAGWLNDATLRYRNPTGEQKEFVLPE